MIYEGSLVTEDWNIDAENAAFHHINKLHFKIYSNRKKMKCLNLNVIILQFLLYFCFK